ncbi:MAG: UDP-N-acetylglucosamine 2-epimerase (non-hydrolyzing) [Candidatus Aenigmatarchaeota archaeon]
MIAIIMGTRPEIIKMSPVIKECEKRGLEYFILHTGQHYSYNMDKLFYKQLSLPLPDYTLGIRSKSPMLQSEHTGRMLIRIEQILLKEKPDVVLVQGDTNTVLAGSVCVSKLKTSPINMNIKLGHIEAGLRSYDRTMTEEINRVLSDHMSDYLFAATKQSKDNALKEGIEEKKIYITGNTIVDAVYDVRKMFEKSDILDKLNLRKGEYFLVTAHRQENVDDNKKLKGIMDGLEKLYNEFKIDIIYPMHPRTKKMLDKFKIRVSKNIRVIEPVGFFEMLKLEANAKLVLTDAGGLQEESCILHVPCVTLRENTERPETLKIGNVLAGTKPDNILKAAKIMLKKRIRWSNPFGNGHAATKILYILK